MKKCLAISIGALMLALAAPSLLPAQTAPAGEAKKAPPAPPRDLTGIWDPGNAGLQVMGPGKMRARFTPYGEELFKANKPGRGFTEVPVADANDPNDSCDPSGFPRNEMYELRPVQIVQTKSQILMLYQFNKIWRVIWTDGRPLPKDHEPTWYGYSVGHWENDDTFVVDTAGFTETTWLDNAGDPHSSDMRVQERFHRLDRDTLELSITIDDPKVYQKPWTGTDKLILKLQPANTELLEMICVPTEMELYKKIIANPAAGK